MTTLELNIFHFINQQAAFPGLDPLMNFISSAAVWGSVIAAASLLGFLWDRRKFTRIFLFFFVAVAFTDLLNYQVLKQSLGRLRPCHERSDVRLAAPSCGGNYGLPSNHSANGAAVLVMWFLLIRRKKIGLLFTALFLLVCYSRVYLGVHYPSDILVGALVGGSIAWLVYRGGQWKFQPV